VNGRLEAIALFSSKEKFVLCPEVADPDGILLPNILGGAFASDPTVDGTTRQR